MKKLIQIGLLVSVLGLVGYAQHGVPPAQINYPSTITPSGGGGAPADGITGTLTSGRVPYASGAQTLVDAAAFKFDGSRLLLSATTPAASIEAGANLLVIEAQSSDVTGDGMAIGFANGTDFDGPRIVSYLTGGTFAAKTVPAVGSAAFFFSNNVWNGTIWSESANLQAKVAGAPLGDGYVPTQWVVSWVPNAVGGGNGNFAYFFGNTDGKPGLKFEDISSNAGQIKLSGSAEWSLRDAADSAYADLKLKSLTIDTGAALKTDTTTAHTALFQAYDVDNTTYRTFGTLTNGNTPSLDLSAPSGGTLTVSATSLTTSGNVNIGNGLVFTSYGALFPANNGIWTLYNAAQTDFGRLQFGGTTASFPALKRSAAKIQVRLADDSAAGTFEGKYNSSDGTAGATTICTIAGLVSITVKDGLITSCS